MMIEHHVFQEFGRVCRFWRQPSVATEAGPEVQKSGTLHCLLLVECFVPSAVAQYVAAFARTKMAVPLL